jgi:hypothetical protein
LGSGPDRQCTDERGFAAQHSAGYDAWLDHVWPAACTRPVRLRGAIRHISPDGELLRTIPTVGMPDGLIYKPCVNRRTTVCPACAETYRRDAYHLIRAGLIGGKGISPTIADHPGGLRHLHRPVLRARPHPLSALAYLHRPVPVRMQAPALSRPPDDPDLPAWPPAGVLHPASTR